MLATVHRGPADPGQGAGQPGGHPDAEQLLVGVGEQAADVYLESALFSDLFQERVRFSHDFQGGLRGGQLLLAGG